MSNAVSALNGLTADGFAIVQEMGLQGMVTLRGDLSSSAFRKTVKVVSGLDVPNQRQAHYSETMGVAWMSPDELLVLCPYADAQNLADTATKSLGKTHSLVVNVSDARAMFTVSGQGAREVIAKLAPVDMAAFQTCEIRRTRLAQVPAAFWLSGEEEITVVVFRSVAQYVFDLLKTAAASGGEVGFLMNASG